MENSETLAGVLIDRLGVRGKPDLTAIANKLGIRIREVDSEGFDGALVRVPGRRGAIIAVKASLPETARKRFTIAHEIGHFVLPGHDSFEVCSAKTLETWSTGVPQPELEANEFAAELLLPTKHVRSMLGQRFPDFSAIRRTASEYETSLTATIRKFLRLTEHACAMVWSKNGQIVWSKRSEAFTLSVRRGKLDPSTRASGLFVSRKQEEPGFEGRPSHLWLKPPGDATVDRIMECSVHLPHYDSVLTLLWIEDVHALVSDKDEALEEPEPG
jgi:Zn-dependent peptidase ImmA (M78 family)